MVKDNQKGLTKAELKQLESWEKQIEEIDNNRLMEIHSKSQELCDNFDKTKDR